jgi:hypothetical protein
MVTDAAGNGDLWIPLLRPECLQELHITLNPLLHCPEHLRARQELYRAAGPDVYVLYKLLGSPKLLPHLCRYLG